MAEVRGRTGRIVTAALVALVATGPALTAAAAGGDIAAAAEGERLFAGTRRFANGGPACAECHDIAGLPFPHGGSVGPDLTGSYSKYGPGPLGTVLATLYFPTMQALFTNRLLTPEERADLTAFFQRAEAVRAPTRVTLVLAVAALGGALALLVAASITWRTRLRGVRRPILAEAKGRRVT